MKNEKMKTCFAQKIEKSKMKTYLAQRVTTFRSTVLNIQSLDSTPVYFDRTCRLPQKRVAEYINRL